MGKMRGMTSLRAVAAPAIRLLGFTLAPLTWILEVLIPASDFDPACRVTIQAHGGPGKVLPVSEQREACLIRGVAGVAVGDIAIAMGGV